MEGNTNWLMVLGVLAASFAGGAFCHWALTGGSPGASPDATVAQERVVSATEFVLLDADGRTRGSLMIRPDGSPGLGLYDDGGNTRVALVLGTDGRPILALYDKDRKRQAAIGIEPDGKGRLVLDDKGGGGLLVSATSEDAAARKPKRTLTDIRRVLDDVKKYTGQTLESHVRIEDNRGCFKTLDGSNYFNLAIGSEDLGKKVQQRLISIGEGVARIKYRPDESAEVGKMGVLLDIDVAEDLDTGGRRLIELAPTWQE